MFWTIMKDLVLISVLFKLQILVDFHLKILNKICSVILTLVTARSI